MPIQKSQEVLRAEAILASPAAPADELEALAKALQSQQSFGLARRLLARRYEQEEVQIDARKKLEIGRKLALNTYKDPDLPVDERLKTALRLLKELCSLDQTKDQETLGLAGAVYKRIWEASARKQDLERSLSYYQRGADQGAKHDNGYTAINAAYVRDLLAALEASDLTDATPLPEAAQLHLQKARELREDILTKVPQPQDPQTNDYWNLVTRAEALMGLGQFQAAGMALSAAGGLPGVPDWQKETTTRQLAGLVRLRQKLPMQGQDSIQDAWRALSHLIGGNVSAAQNAYFGRIGLALSGGGFRASLFHIGVLARLAEVDLLRGIGFLSCVSGGSIIGAHYYLHVRQLLQTKRDDQITPDDYVQIVKKIADEFLDGVQRNIRTRVAAEWTTNLKMIFFPNYSRTLRVGELYERELFARVDGEEHKSWLIRCARRLFGGEKKLWLNELTIQPLGEAPNFSPKTHNWRRQAKAPTLILNATTLNTGHNWQFTATWMGEPPAGLTSEVDANYLLRRLYYWEAPPAHRAIRLGYAVAASSCVPGLFEPLPLEELYPGRIVRLVDGGVHDNQGIGALIEQDCNVLLVSDASGQMDTIDDPSTGLLGVPLRSNSIALARIREAQFREALTRHRAGLLSGFVFLHLKKGLESPTIDWIDCQEPSEPPAGYPRTDYYVQKKIQRQIAAIRTDLDSFSDTEAFALMTSGYMMTQKALEEPGAVGFPVTNPDCGSWTFLAVKPQMTAATPDKTFMKRLKDAEVIAFKVWRQSRILQLGASIASLALLVFLIAQWEHWSSQPLPRAHPPLTLGIATMIVITAILLSLFAPRLMRLVRVPKTFQQLVIGIGMTTFGFVVARLHLHVFDKIFLRLGRIRPRSATGGMSRIPAGAMFWRR
jgi:predicted acylesterase/phospholipase RssA